MAIFLISMVIFASAAGLFWMLRSHPHPAQRRPAHGGGAAKADRPAAPPRPGGIDKLSKNELFWGVEMCNPGCEAARKLLGQQFTFDEAPALPLPDCSSAPCTCQFKGLPDKRHSVRRSGVDRRTDIRFDKDHPERRSRRGRRRSDRWNDHSY